MLKVAIMLLSPPKKLLSIEIEILANVVIDSKLIFAILLIPEFYYSEYRIVATLTRVTIQKI